MLNTKEYQDKEIDLLCMTGEKRTILDAKKYDIENLKKIDKNEYMQMIEEMKSWTKVGKEVLFNV